MGSILADKTVKGGTGWGAEFAKLCNKPLYVFDQDKGAWFEWVGQEWQVRHGAHAPVVTHVHFTGTGTRVLTDAGRAAIEALFDRSLGT